MPYSLTKTFRFEASHRLPYHNGKCRNLHGHSYEVTIEVSQQVELGLIEPPMGIHEVARLNPESGMVTDFANLSDAWKQGIEPLLDHRHLNDVVDYPTAERLAHFIYNRFTELLDDSIRVDSVSVAETPTSSATYRP